MFNINTVSFSGFVIVLILLSLFFYRTNLAKIDLSRKAVAICGVVSTPE